MPLAFESLSHGTIAFGFFNIDSDLLLLDHYFFFADDFCRNVEKIAGSPSNQTCEDIWQIYHIADPGLIGDLHTAIHGVRGLSVKYIAGFRSLIKRRISSKNPKVAGTGP